MKGCAASARAPFLGLDLDARAQQSLEERDTNTGQRQTDTGKQQQRLTNDFGSNVTNPSNDRGKNLANTGHQSCNSSGRSSDCFLLS